MGIPPTELSDEFFKVLVEQSTQGMSVADLEGNYIFVNDTFCKMTGYSQVELLQMTVFDIKAPKQDHNNLNKLKVPQKILPHGWFYKGRMAAPFHQMLWVKKYL